MSAHVMDYLTMRREMGFALDVAGRQLEAFAEFADRTAPRSILTAEIACRWAMSAPSGRSFTWARRLEIVRPFARYLAARIPGTEIPAPSLFGRAHRRLSPHIYRPEEIGALLTAAHRLLPKDGLRPHTYHALFGLIAAAGLRLSEALNLQIRDFDPGQGLLQIRMTKFRKSRLVPLHSTTTAALVDYLARRNCRYPGSRRSPLFVGASGAALPKSTVENTFQRMRDRLGWQARGSHAHPRIHDLRHTFICRALLRSYQNRRCVDADIRALSTYVGHAKVTHTYWYVTGIPELMRIAGRRFEQLVQAGAP